MNTLVQSLAALLRPYRLRGKLRLLRALAPDQGEYTARLFGYQVALDLGEDIQRDIYLGGFEPHETALVRRLLQPGMTVVDVGANVGYYTLLAASRVGRQGRVFAVEPSPYAHGRLARTVAYNRLNQVHLIQAALGATPGEATLYLPAACYRNHSPTMVANPSGVPVVVSQRTLDTCLTEWRADQVDLLKLDVEGYEVQVLTGAREALAAGRIRAVLCEFNDFWLRGAGSSPQLLWQLLAEAGFVDAFCPNQLPNFSEGCMASHLLVRQ